MRVELKMNGYVVIVEMEDVSIFTENINCKNWDSPVEMTTANYKIECYIVDVANDERKAPLKLIHYLHACNSSELFGDTYILKHCETGKLTLLLDNETYQGIGMNRYTINDININLQ